MKLNDTTRTFPRTLAEAFPDNVEDQQRLQQGEWMEQHQPDYEVVFFCLLFNPFTKFSD